MSTNASRTNVAHDTESRSSPARPLLLGVTVLLALSVPGTAGWYWWVRLPDPATARPEQLGRWLATRDLRDEPLDVSLALVERLEQHMHAPTAEAAPLDGAPVPARYREQVERNAEWLLELWFRTRVEQYERLAAHERLEFLDRQLETVFRWTELHRSLRSDSSAQPSSAPLADVFDRIGRWIREAPGERRAAMAQTVTEALVVWLATRDLHHESPELRTRLALRIADELGQGERRPLSFELADDQRRQLQANGRLLFQAWFYAQVDQWSRLEEAGRVALVDREIERVMQSGVLEWIAPQGQGASQPTQGLGELNRLLDRWVDQADADRRDDVQRMADQLRARLAARQLQQLWQTLHGS